ncbi:MAG: DNA methylase [Eggerthellaceae bacterium]|nr:DNA methylase [Eggerthellaceae bacterium]
MGSLFRYIAIDLKSFYASVECQERGLDPLTTNLVVADPSRTEKTICLAVSPSLKAYGISGRARLFEVVQRVSAVNKERLRNLQQRMPNASFSKASYNDEEVRADPSIELAYLVAKPRMALYLEFSTRVYNVYLKYFAPEDIHVYSIDEVLIDAGGYLRTYGMDARQLASEVVHAVYQETGITATAGIGTNLYLAKVAMDMLAKHEEPDERGVRIAHLDEMAYKQRLWDHVPITDFWRVGAGTAKRLASKNMHTMGDVARASLGGPHDALNEDVLFKLFGKNAELLIDHAWGIEPVQMEDIKAYRPQTRCMVSGQVLHCPYSAPDARIVAWEMAEQLALDLTEKQQATDTLVLTVGYDRKSLDIANAADGTGPRIEVVQDRYGRDIPKHAHGTRRLDRPTASAHLISEAVLGLFDELVNPDFLVRRLTIAAERMVSQEELAKAAQLEQLSLFTEEPAVSEEELEREKRIQETMIGIRGKFGKNAVLKAASLQESATAMQRNQQIGGHSA